MKRRVPRIYRRAYKLLIRREEEKGFTVSNLENLKARIKTEKSLFGNSGHW